MVGKNKESRLSADKEFLAAIELEVKKSGEPIINRDKSFGDVRIGSRLYELKIRHSNGQLHPEDVQRLQTIHPDILEPIHTIKWNSMFGKVKDYFNAHNVNRIKPSNDPALEKLRFWVNHQIKILNKYFREYRGDLKNHGRHIEMNRRSDELQRIGINVIPPRKPQPNDEKTYLIRNIKHQIETLRRRHGEDFYKIRKSEIEEEQKKLRKEQERLADAREYFAYLEVNSHEY